MRVGDPVRTCKRSVRRANHGIWAAVYPQPRFLTSAERGHRRPAARPDGGTTTRARDVRHAPDTREQTPLAPVEPRRSSRSSSGRGCWVGVPVRASACGRARRRARGLREPTDDGAAAATSVALSFRACAGAFGISGPEGGHRGPGVADELVDAADAVAGGVRSCARPRRSTACPVAGRVSRPVVTRVGPQLEAPPDAAATNPGARAGGKRAPESRHRPGGGRYRCHAAGLGVSPWPFTLVCIPAPCRSRAVLGPLSTWTVPKPRPHNVPGMAPCGALGFRSTRVAGAGDGGRPGQSRVSRKRSEGPGRPADVMTGTV
jgi:hypothetical protein